MSRSQELIEKYLEIDEEAGKIKRFSAIRNGKRVIIKKKVYNRPKRKGYKRVDGKLVKMSAKEQRNRSISQRKAQRKSSAKNKRKISNRRRKHLIK